MKKVVSVSLDEGVWGKLRDMAWNRKESASSFLEKVIKVGMPKFSEDPARGFYNDDLPDIPKRGENVADKIRQKVKPRDDDEVLAEAQNRLVEIRSYSKAQQLGKGGK